MVLECSPRRSQKALLTDIKGRYGQGFVPEGLVKSEFVAKQKEMVTELLPEVFCKLVIDTEQPFIQPILDLSVDRMYAGSVCLIGDAAFTPRPHTAASTAKAAINAEKLKDMLQQQETIKQALMS